MNYNGPELGLLFTEVSVNACETLAFGDWIFTPPNYKCHRRCTSLHIWLIQHLLEGAYSLLGQQT